MTGVLGSEALNQILALYWSHNSQKGRDVPSWSGSVHWSIFPGTERLRVWSLVRAHTEGNPSMLLSLTRSICTVEALKGRTFSTWRTFR